MKMILIVLLLLAAVVAAAAVFFVTYGRERTWVLVAGQPDLGPYDFEIAKRRRTANDALLCTPPLCGQAADEELPEYDEKPGELISRLDGKIPSLSQHVRRVDDGGNEARSRYVVHTPLMRFPDTVDIEAVPLDNGKTGLRAYGRAQIGRRDMGNNLSRLKRWLGAD